MTRTDRIIAGLCEWSGCDLPPLPDNNHCQRHRDARRVFRSLSKRRRKRARQFAREQLGWVL